MRKENLQDAAEILSTILSHPLEIEGASESPISLLGALIHYPHQHPESSDLSQILNSLTQYPESTETLIQELELLSADLAS